LVAELERPEPLLPGVRYKNTEANRKRIDKDNPVIIGLETDDNLEYGVALWLPASGLWQEELNMHKKDYPEWFALIPDGEVQDE